MKSFLSVGQEPMFCFRVSDTADQSGKEVTPAPPHVTVSDHVGVTDPSVPERVGEIGGFSLKSL